MLWLVLVNLSFSHLVQSGINSGDLKNALTLIRTVFLLIVKSFLTHSPLWLLVTVQAGGRELRAGFYIVRNDLHWLLEYCDENGSFPGKLFLIK